MCFKLRKDPINLGLGEDIKINKVVGMSTIMVVVGIFMGRHMGEMALKAWVNVTWELVVG